MDWFLALVRGQRQQYLRAKEMEWPKTLIEFGYAFNEEGKLRECCPNTRRFTNTPFRFDVKHEGEVSSAEYNQRRYEAIGEAVTKELYKALDTKMFRIVLPPNAKKDDTTFVYSSRKVIGKAKKLLIMIHGSGVVRAGQWSRSLIINESLDHGTMFPYIKKAKTHGYEVLLANTNDNWTMVKGQRHRLIKGSETPEAHIRLVWKHVIEPAIDQIAHFAIVAHSYGGVVTSVLVKEHPQVFKEKCFGIAYTDSVHSMTSLEDDAKKLIQQLGVNWVTSTEPVNTPLGETLGLQLRSAGHTKHEWTSWAAMDSIFDYLEGKFIQSLDKPSDSPEDEQPNLAEQLPAADEAGPSTSRSVSYKKLNEPSGSQAGGSSGVCSLLKPKRDKSYEKLEADDSICVEDEKVARARYTAPKASSEQMDLSSDGVSISYPSEEPPTPSAVVLTSQYRKFKEQEKKAKADKGDGTDGGDEDEDSKKDEFCPLLH